jgi:hypothetical protein
MRAPIDATSSVGNGVSSRRSFSDRPAMNSITM